MAASDSDLRRSLRWVMQAWVFGAVWLYIVAGTPLTQFAKQLRMPEFGFGVLAAIPFAGALLQLPASYFIERYGYRKRFFIGIGIVHRGLWLLVAVVPWIAPAAWAWLVLLCAVGISWALGQLLLPVWVSWMADLVPAPIRGRYFSRRTQLGQMVGILVSLPLGYFLDQATGGAVVLKALSFAFALAAVMGVTDFLFFLPVPELHRPHPNPNVNLWQLVRTPLQDRNFRRFLGFTATMAFATAYVGQFATLYVLDVVGATNLQTQLMLQCGPLCVLMLMYPIWGRLVDRFGRKPVLLISGTLIVPGSVAWIFVSHDHWVVGYAAVLLVTAAWPGIEIANFNLLLGLADATPGKSGGYVAVNSALNAVAGVLSGLFGGAVAQTMAHWHGTLLGWPLTYHGVLFIISGGLRLLALVWLVDLEDPRAATTRVALRYLGTNLYSNLQQAIYLPARLWSQFSRWTYPANRRR